MSPRLYLPIPVLGRVVPDGPKRRLLRLQGLVRNGPANHQDDPGLSAIGNPVADLLRNLQRLARLNPGIKLVRERHARSVPILSAVVN